MADDGFSVVMEGRKFSQDCKQAGLGKAVGGRAKGDVAFPYLICHTKMTTPIFARPGRSIRVSNLDLGCMSGQSIEARLTDLFSSTGRA